MILRVSFLFLLMASALAGMFSSNNKVKAISSGEKPLSENSLPDIRDWTKSSQFLAHELMNQYGMPREYTASMLIWKNNGPWKETILFKEEICHTFPSCHADVLQQTILCKVPVEKFNDLAQFNGSVTANSTNGTLTVRCINEKLNILTLNLAIEIIKNKITVDQARLQYYKGATEIMKGRLPIYAQRLFN